MIRSAPRFSALALIAGFIWLASPTESKAAPTEMSLNRMNDLIEAVGNGVERMTPGQWRFTIEKVAVLVIADETHYRMRILVGIVKADKIPPGVYRRLMQANFDTALDARYAVAKGLLWSLYLHPLKSLTDRLFLSGIGQAVNLYRTFGKTFSSGGLAFQGGDSTGLIERRLIEKLLEQGKAI
ncbi:MAG: hypothetical protein CFH40_00586 [Alphaproteobacteria bacterium MarineAlpha10_Bin3]|jgi:hypothetical protein|nr:MAG: hypothetical protein CFH40_00586 [Alphaproteobacteria bacterium MarineAlpha10_Bin3]PPR74544.1 MAG: hypothetical protein CFH09_00586 [Alphaproteobacteria bacterium MarineAlpha4_Bin1]